MTIPDRSSNPKYFDDVRMRGFAKRATVSEVWKWLDDQATILPPEDVDLLLAGSRVLARSIVSAFDVPQFDRSMMDGVAVRADDTLGASPYNQLPLRIVGDVLPGNELDVRIGRGEAALIMTGAPIPAGADAVLPAEKIDCSAERVLALDEVSPGKNIGRKAEDIAAGTQVLSSGRFLRPQDLGLLSSIGVGTVPVIRRPRVRIVITGSELLPAGSRPEGTHIVDANGPMLAALVNRDGGVPVNPGIVPDEPAAILQALMSDSVDLVIVSGGSSVGVEDHAPKLVAVNGILPIHGIAMRPSSPTGIGQLAGRLVFLLPGNPVSCLCAYDFFAGRAIRMLGGRDKNWPYRSTMLRLRRKLVSTVGRLDYARVKIVDGEVEPLSIAGASILSSTTRADGFVIIPDDCEGYPAGVNVQVYLYG